MQNLLDDLPRVGGDGCSVRGRRAPYGYRPGAGSGLEADPRTASVVRRIFDEYTDGAGLQAIAERLTADGIPCPSAYDPRRNPHHSGSAWSKVAVRAILLNDRYAQLRDGSPEGRRTEPPLIPADVFRRSRDILARRAGLAHPASPEGVDPGRYALRGRLRCGLCDRLMQGTWNNQAAYYRCRFAREYARVNGIDHPTNVYLRQDRLMRALEKWIRQPLPRLLSEQARRQPPAIRMRWAGRAAALRALLMAPPTADAQRLYAALGLRLIYEPAVNAVQVCSAPLWGVQIVDRFAL